ncbi:MAG: hypothetical protein IJ781_04585 [Atopobiaceae bacterium]|nr:hypothetical protein [Atopobiaceae bacterium]
MAQYPFMSDKTGRRIATALEAMVRMNGLVYDETAGEYTPESITAMLDAYRNGLSYGVSIPKGSATACTKIGANAGIANPTPGIVGRAADDPYTMLGPFVHFDVNGYVDADGIPHVTAFEGDGRFRRDGSNGDVWVLAPVLWWAMEEGDAAVALSVSDGPAPGMSLQPQALLPDGSRRPFMLYAKYVGVRGDDGLMHSYAGRKPWNRNVSHNSLITQCANASSGYSGKNVADDWYIKVMFLLKYATKNSQSVFAGCTSYDVQLTPTVAESAKTRVIVSNADAAKLVVGSAMMLGTHTATNKDRNQAYNHDVFDSYIIEKIEAYDTANMAVYLDATEPFDVDTTYLFSTSPWHSGACDAVEGDGTRTAAGRTNGHEPFVMQGVEIGHGMYECLGNVILENTGDGWEICICNDSKYEASSVTANYTRTGKYLPADTADGWKYPMYHESANGLLVGLTTGASQTTGLCDGQYTNKLATTGTREFLGLGDLSVGGNAGLFCLSGAGTLSNASWRVGSRLSGVGRSRAAA